MNKPLDLIDQLADIRTQLTEERKTLMARVSLIDQALGMTGAPKPSKPKAPAAPKAGSVAEAILGYVSQYPASTIREIQDHFAIEHKASTVESTVRSLAAAGKLTKDDQTPRHFSLPEKSTEPSELPGPSARTSSGPGNAARPQPRA